MSSAAQGYVVRPTRTATWNYIRGHRTASAYGTCRPNRRWFVSIDAWDEEAYAPLLAAMREDLRHDLYTNMSGDDEEGLRRWEQFGFEIARREIVFKIPVDPAITGLTDASPPDGIVLIPADAVDEPQLRDLDDRLRADVPGSQGWVNDPAEFREYTFDERHFDPLTYLVAVDDFRQEFAGLARVWTTARHSRLGLIGVTAAYRRRGLARALLAAVFGPLHERGVTHVSAEADATNVASINLLESIGAARTDETLELVRRAER
ncbi:MAG: GNAT family N-acetyltransferase [Actinomycetota bacterium]|nr:GNAT family N-acetyltransferase [Actinomycetota bacterium]